eukprot:GHVS01084780.1.p1 GENE.GHVS01084780.1~~GHVS01084780.1.p1  ORF type:complete len:147 (+),score=31.78 GHVS01084780.1:140-580(+)
MSAPPPAAVRVRLEGKPVISLTELAKHNTPANCWLAIGGVVYDVTAFLADHPGGPEVVINASGQDATNEFEEISHSINARNMAEQFELGLLEGCEATATGTEKATLKSTKSTTATGDSGGGFGVLPFILVGLIAAVAYFTMGTSSQ